MDLRTEFRFWQTALSRFSILDERPITLPRVVCLKDGKAAAPQPLGPHGLWPDPHADELQVQVETEVPWPDARLRLDVDGEGLLQVDGISRAASNAFHRHADLHLPPGRHLLSLDVLRTGLMGVEVAAPRLRLGWQRIDREAQAAAFDLEVLAEWTLDEATPPAAAALGREGLLAALRPLRALPPDRAVLQDWLRREGASAEEEGLRRALRGAEGGLPALQGPARDEVAAAVRDCASALRRLFGQLQAQLPKGAAQAVPLGHAHIDLAWLWRMETARKKARRTYATQAELLANHPEWRLGVSQPELWQWLKEDDPELFRRLVSLVRDGRIEPLGATWVEIDGQLPDAAAVLRHLLYGLRYYEAQLGVRPRTAFLPDSFGFAAGLPTLLAAAGVRHFCTTKLRWNDTTRFPYTDFTWVGPDGATVQGHLFSSAEGGYNAPATLGDLRRTAERHAADGGRGPFLYAFGYGDGGGGPTPEMLERLRRYRELPLMPDLTWAPLASNLPVDGTPSFRGPLYLEYHRGTYTSQSWAKYLLRQAEAHLAAAEARSTWARAGRTKPSPDWRALMRLQFHDILPGSSIGPVYKDLRAELEALLGRARHDDAAAMAALAGEGPGRACLVLGNRAGFASPARLVEVSRPYAPLAADGSPGTIQRSGDAYLVQAAALPAFGTAALPVTRVEPPAPRPPGPCDEAWLEGGDLRIRIGAAGIESLLYAGEEMLDGVAGLEIYRQHPEQFDAWELVPPEFRVPLDLGHLEPVQVEFGPLRDAVLLRHKGPEGLDVQERIALERQSGALTVSISAKLPARHVVLRYALPTKLKAHAVTAEGMWGTELHPVVAAGPADSARYEWPAQRFVDISEPHLGLALLNDARYGHAVQGGTLYLTLATSPLYPDPHADEEPAPVCLELRPHRGDWRDAGILAAAHVHAAGIAAELRESVPKAPAGPCSGLPDNLRLLGMKPAEDGSGDIIVYLGELCGDRGACVLSFPWTLQAAVACDLVTEQAQDDQTLLSVSEDGQRAHLRFLPYQPITIRIRPVHDEGRARL